MLVDLINKLVVVALTTLMLGCQSVNLTPGKDTITFIDTQNFDSEFAASLTNIKAPITVDFYTTVTPNQIPARLEKWMALAETNGAKLTVTQPQGEMAPKDPFLLLGLFTGLWDLITRLRVGQVSYSMEEAIKNRNVNINLARNPQGGLFIEKVVFIPKEVK